MHIEQRKVTGLRSCATIISDEPPPHLERLVDRLGRYGIDSVIQPAGSPRRVGVGYIRSIDPRLGGGSSFVEIAALGARPAFMLNTPGSVRIAEWSPLATHALRDRGVPQPRRIWCLDDRDLARAAIHLGTPLIVEGVVTGRRVEVSAPDELERALAAAVGSHPARGALAEVPLRGVAARISMMVIDGACMPLTDRQMRSVSPLARMRAALVAVDAVAALGGSAMAVHVVIDADDDAYVDRIEAAPQLGRLNDEAMTALVGAITARLGAARPFLRIGARAAGRTPTAFVQVGRPC